MADTNDPFDRPTELEFIPWVCYFSLICRVLLVLYGLIINTRHRDYEFWKLKSRQLYFENYWLNRRNRPEKNCKIYIQEICFHGDIHFSCWRGYVEYYYIMAKLVESILHSELLPLDVWHLMICIRPQTSFRATRRDRRTQLKPSILYVVYMVWWHNLRLLSIERKHWNRCLS